MSQTAKSGILMLGTNLPAFLNNIGFRMGVIPGFKEEAKKRGFEEIALLVVVLPSNVAELGENFWINISSEWPEVSSAEKRSFESGGLSEADLLRMLSSEYASKQVCFIGSKASLERITESLALGHMRPV